MSLFIDPNKIPGQVEAAEQPTQILPAVPLVEVKVPTAYGRATQGPAAYTGQVILHETLPPLEGIGDEAITSDTRPMPSVHDQAPLPPLDR